MKRGFSIWFHVIIVFASAWAIVRCEDGQPRLSNRGHPQGGDLSQAAVPLESSPLTSETLAPPAALELDPAKQELFWALARCQCAPAAKAAFLKELALSRGTLPQPLVPTIREQIRGDSKLKILDVLPTGLSDLVTDFFANDDKIAGEIRTGVAEKIAKFAPGRPRLGERVAFRFDGFPRLGSRKELPPEFQLRDQLPRWHLAFATESLWQDRAPLGGDHGLQTLETMRTLVEWQYMIGLQKNPEGGSYGGLTLDAAQGGQTLAGPYDPRADPEAQRFFSGLYKIAFPSDVSSLDLATKAREKWAVQVGKISLSEQAQLWHTAALAFQRLRPENRDAVQAMFGAPDAALFPNDTHQLPLAFLPGLSALLDGPLINKESRLIRRYANLNGAGSDEPAQLQDLARLLAALMAWTTELENLDGADLADATHTSLTDGRASMRKAGQLATQTILQHFTQPSAGYGIALGASPSEPATIAQAAEALMALTSAEQGALDSAFLRSRIVSIFHWFVGDLLAPRFNQNQSFTDEEIIWAHAALTAFAPYADKYGDEWYEPTLNAVNNIVAAWDGSAP